jgi:hypothetical protein
MSLNKLPVLNGHNVAFKGKRFWVIEVDEDHPFEWVTADLAQYVVYDKPIGATIATCSKLPRGKFSCEYSYGQISLTCIVDRIENVGRVVFSEINNLIRDCS